MKNKSIKVLIAGGFIVSYIVGIFVGYMANDGKYDIVDKQDEIEVVFENIKALYNTDINKRNEIGKKITSMQETETLSETKLQNLDAYIVEYEELLPEINKQALLMSQLQFSYRVLEEMK